MHHCSRCGTHIKNIFKFRGNIYGSECIHKIPVEELSESNESIDLESIVNGLKYAGIKSHDIDNVIRLIPKIGDNIIDYRPDLEEHKRPRCIVLGYGKHKRKLRGSKRRTKDEFAIRVKRIVPGHPRMNTEGWMYLDTIIKK